jgi:hypothetical protein
MGYRSDVTIVMYPRHEDDYPMLKLFVEENLPDEFEEHAVERSFAEVVFSKGESTVFRYLLFQFDSVKWYQGYEGVDVYTCLFSEWRSKFRDVTDPEGEPLFHYEFMRIGEDFEDIVYDCSPYGDNILRVDRRTYVDL